ncbi:single-stranded DNA-binding protein [Helicobacter sp. MIT 21-1697]|uniref:single-stranded DNA-binding protein n=1 Tax=Helicobacter sp. MIT 21-1697 TaxID=2993733 RepID=UPI00224AF2F3|nr:single-stranded DNA-binding protein [Helicobacter sp. MIT 21-1697]MCX2716316.1 single-stranded DNA-binding protein [Helicobacter sp. MIT 21-1697]
MYNKVIIIGNLTRDVELRYLPSGSALATIGLASNRRFKKQDGTNGEEVCFVDVKLFGRSAEVANQYLRKGSKILIEGRLSLESWTDQSGAKKSKHTITAESMQMLDSKPSGDESAYNGANGYNAGAQNVNNAPNYNQAHSQSQGNEQGNGNIGAYPQNIPEINIDDEDIPF